MRLSARLAKLEERLAPDDRLEMLTNDELSVTLLDTLRQIVADTELGPDERAAAAVKVAKTEADARWQAALARHPAYAAALNRVRELIPGFVPAIFGQAGCENGWVEVADLEKPQVMERRAALRSRPDIQSLIEAGAKETAPVDFGGQYVADAITSWTPRHSGRQDPDRSRHRVLRPCCASPKRIGSLSRSGRRNCRATP